MISIIPSILTDSPQELRAMINACEDTVDRVSIDIIDGVFADNKTIDPTALKDVDTGLKFDFQLMTKEPINWVVKCVSAGADRVIGHIEMMASQVDFVARVQAMSVGIGLGLDLETPVAQLDEQIVGDLDVVYLMSVPAGFGGQEFNKDVLAKIEELKKIREREQSPFAIHVDGGVNKKNVAELAKRGADEVSVGRSLLKGGDLSVNIKRLTDAIGDIK